MNRRNVERKDGEGRLPASAPLANPYVPFQSENPDRYDAKKALIRGTLYAGLDLPFKGMVNNKLLPETPMTQMQMLAFAIQELALYLDTHRDDAEALMLYRNYQKMYEKFEAEYRRKYGPTNHFAEGFGSEYRWLDDPWPWEYQGKGRVK